MKVFMLDTDICSYILRDHPRNLKEIFLTHCSTATVCISVITYAELLAGAAQSGSKRIQEKIADFTGLFEIIDWTASCAQRYATVRTALLKAGAPIGNMDMLIASAALATGATLVTNNEKHFARVDGLQITNWLH